MEQCPTCKVTGNSLEGHQCFPMHTVRFDGESREHTVFAPSAETAATEFVRKQDMIRNYETLHGANAAVVVVDGEPYDVRGDCQPEYWVERGP